MMPFKEHTTAISSRVLWLMAAATALACEVAIRLDGYGLSYVRGSHVNCDSPDLPAGHPHLAMLTTLYVAAIALCIVGSLRTKSRWISALLIADTIAGGVIANFLRPSMNPTVDLCDDIVSTHWTVRLMRWLSIACVAVSIVVGRVAWSIGPHSKVKERA